MSLFKSVFLAASFAGVLSVSALLAACTLSPVYSTPALVQSQLSLSFAKPATRLEQIVYQDLALRFPGSDGTRVATVSVGISNRDAGLSRVSRLTTEKEVRATGILTVVENGKLIFTATRFATSSYTTDGQILADNSAAIQASEQATHALAEQLRLALLASLGQ
jgi:hypothetical protein